tara:strand:- start:428 stop:607 length:180 start_codon:yes stop_codon:yes gene_type:complete
MLLLDYDNHAQLLGFVRNALDCNSRDCKKTTGEENGRNPRLAGGVTAFAPSPDFEATRQ